jgi:hypothetical protein
MHELHQDYGSAVTIHDDNRRRIAISKNIMITRWRKHKGKGYTFCREKAESGDIEVKYCPTKDMLADVLTKPLVSTRQTYWLCHVIMR